MLLKSITPPLQGGGRWFKSSIAHLKNGVLQAKRRWRKEATVLDVKGKGSEEASKECGV
jgi:hypothetical protein